MAEDEARRRNEMSMFAAMALGGEEASMDDSGHNATSNNTAATATSSMSSSAFDPGSVVLPAPKAAQNEMSAFAAAAGGNPGAIDNIFSQSMASSLSEMDSGTFAMTSTTSADKEAAAAAGESRLAAAAAALAVGEDDDDDDSGGRGDGDGIGGLATMLPGRMLRSSASSEEKKFRKITEDQPMYSEEVKMPRPLFFGPIVPPRVLNEARQIVKKALQDQKDHQKDTGGSSSDADTRPRLSSLPPEVQNIVGALHQYGFGLSAFPSEEDGEETKDHQLFWKGTSYVSTFQPVFGETARHLRHDKDDGTTEALSQQQIDDEEAIKEHTKKPRSASNASQLLSDETMIPSMATIPAPPAPPKTPMTEMENANASFLANFGGGGGGGGMGGGGTVDSQEGLTTTTTTTTPPKKDPPAPDAAANNEISNFSMWARGEGAADDGGNNDNSDSGDDNASQGNNSTGSSGSFTKPAAGSKSKQPAATAEPEPMSDQQLFSQWAQGPAPSENNTTSNNSGTFQMDAVQKSREKPAKKKKMPAFGTFQRVPTPNVDNDSDDDSIVGSELKQKVGVNEHLDAALESLMNDGTKGDDLGRDDEDDNTMLQMARSTPGGRPLSNLELTNGCVPIYGIDDQPLPVEGDLGIHETKNDEQKTLEQNRSQELINKYVGQNLFGAVACPNPATGPDDNHSWNSRAAPSQRRNMGMGTGAPHSGPDRVAVLPVPNEAAQQSPKPPSGPASQQSSPKPPSRNRLHVVSASTTSSTPISRKKSGTGGPTSANKRGGRFNARHRYGWWSIPEDHHEANKGGANASSRSVASAASSGVGTTGGATTCDQPTVEPLQLPPMHHTSFNLHVDTKLQPGPEQLRNENLPLSELHSATSAAHGLPYLSDRPPSYRYLQIDTQAVGFPPLGGDVEPLFCSLAIYNVETINGGASDATPMPDLQRCGRVTETLHFDVVSDKQVEDRCIGALWPFFSSSTMTPQSSKSNSKSHAATGSMSQNPSLQGTRCGVFPLASNLNVANLYAVLLVQKVLSEDSDFEIYLKQSKSSRSSGGIDMNKFRSRAEKASNQHGSFLMPFAFGVAPLLQVFGADNPLVASSRAVQIPLFRFSAGLGERQIIDHIMVMLYPRADFRANGVGGPAAVTNGGTAMLVMRNFGYLGLHAVVHSRSSLARDRLVDFTGELQIRRRNEGDPAAANKTAGDKPDDHTYVVPDWHSQFISEPAINGGRNSVDPIGTVAGPSKVENSEDNTSRSPLYAQELASVPLSPVPFSTSARHMTVGGVQPRVRTPVNRGDIEPYYHTSFCNEMLCHPRLLHNCPKGNIVMKVEMREMEWNQEHNTFFAHLPRQGPSVHNTRRGPFLIQGTYTSCAVKSSDPHFLDEVKVKLPLELKSRRTDGTTRTLSLFFSVYHVKFSSKKKWSKELSKVMPIKGGKKRDSSVSHVNDVNEATGERQDSGEEGGLPGKCKLVLLNCGFLPLTSQSCLIENGLHDVKMMYRGRRPTAEMREKGIPASSLVVKERNEASVQSQRDSQVSSGFDPRDDDATIGSSISRVQSEADLMTGDESESDSFPTSEDNWGGTLTEEMLEKIKSSPEQMSLQVRIIVHSSLHAQNPILCDFLQKESAPAAVKVTDKAATDLLKLDRDMIVSHFGTEALGGDRLTLQDEDRLLHSVTNLSKPQMCSTSELSKHLLRVTTKLWKTLVFGTGQTDLAWANPASTMPLRVHAFGSLLQILGSASLFMLKSGTTQVDGSSKFDLLTLGNVLALLFDEEAIFGCDVTEVLGDIDLFAKPIPKAAATKSAGKTSPQEPKEKLKRRPRHQRNTFEFSRGSVDVSDPTSSAGNLIDMSNLDFGATEFGAISLPPSQCEPNGSFEELQKPLDSLPKADSPPKVNAAAFISGGGLGIDTAAVSSDSENLALSPLSGPKAEVKIDSVTDFLLNMQLGSQSESDNSVDAPLTASNVNNIMKSFGGMSGAGRNRWRTAPAPNLGTINEDEEGGDELAPLPTIQTRTASDGPLDSVDSELILQVNAPSRPRRVMRVPKVTGKAAPANPTNDLSMIAEKAMAPTKDRKYMTLSGPIGGAKMNPLLSPSTPKNEDDLIEAGMGFLDNLGANIGFSSDFNTAPSNNGRRHRHQKTPSKCSVDWTTMGSEPNDAFEMTATSKDKTSLDLLPQFENDENDDSMSTLQLENENCIILPNFTDRLVAIGKWENNDGRWFPYTYEVVIMIWTAFLVQQRASRVKMGSSAGTNGVQESGPGCDSNANLAEAASNTHRVAIACAPMLFEVIKQSLAYRVKVLTQKFRGEEKGKSQCMPLAVLDEALQATLERLISMITDACLDSRNFDSRDVRQMSIDVNDSIVRFLRDMFGFLKPTSAYRLVAVYLSRFVTKEGKQWQDRDSSIGLRCSWEITKLRLNAMTALIRFPDFLRVCSPQMNTWGSSWMQLEHNTQDDFYDSVLDHYKRLELPDFVTDGSFHNSEVKIPPMRPHWLVEVATEICLQGTEHAEQYIQMRAASLLHELFWSSSQQSMGKGTSQVVASMYITFLDKVLLRTSYLSNFAPKSQLRKDILPCVLFVLQGAPNGLLRAQWRKLCLKAQGKGNLDRFGGIGVSMFADVDVRPVQDPMKNSMGLKNDPDILDVFTILNMALSTVEYEGCEDLLESESGEHDDQLLVWHKEYLLSQGQENQQPFMGKNQKPSRGGGRQQSRPSSKHEMGDSKFFTSGSRKWQAHDASMVAIQCSSQIVSELSAMLEKSHGGQAHLKKPRRTSVPAFNRDLPFGNLGGKEKPKAELHFSRSDTVIFVRAAASLYLHSLALRQSDIVLVRTFKVSSDLVKIFGIKLFLEAVGETLQHWMRVVSLHCGGRRAKVRIEATDLLELILRCTWETYGSFFRIRVPLLAVQTEVMERIVAIAAARYYREERRKGTILDNFSNASAEASLAPLWRTLDRLHHQPASQNVAFKGALVRLAVKLKKLYRAYIAARALSYLNGVKSPTQDDEAGENGRGFDQTDALVRAYRITVLRVINASAGYSKQFLGFHGTSLSNSAVAHYEAVEDAFIDAADVFSPTELPEHRVAWLQMLADFHATRNKRAEEATCHFQIHVTLKQASFLHGSLWSNTPFLPWTNSPHDPVHIDGEAPSGNPMDFNSDFDFDEASDSPYGRSMDGANSSRRIFYRVANSVRANTEDWETGLSKTLFCGVTFATEYCSVSSWITLREMEEKMVEEAEIAGDLFLQSGVIESSRTAWNLATEYYSTKFMYSKLANVYGCLARAVVSQVPPIDASGQQEVSISMGRFYRVWFHGGAPDELIGAEFVYRTASWIRLDQFGEQLREVIQCIIPDRTPIHLVLDGRADEGSKQNYGGFSRLGPAPLEPVRIKVTPLRPLFAKGAKIRGLPEWFHRYIDEALARAPSRQSTKRHRGGPRTGMGDTSMGRAAQPGHRGNNLSFSSASVFASGGSSSGSLMSRRSSLSKVVGDGNRGSNSGSSSAETELVGVDKFGFLQPVHHKDRIKGNKDWWKPASGDFAQKSLKVTQLQVRQFFPACVSRQPVVHRIVFTLSPLEAGVDGVCQWSSVLFRTAVATNGMAVLGINPEPGIGTHAAKVVADCIHSSRVKEMGLSLLKKTSNVAEVNHSDMFQSADRLMEDEVNKFQQKLARAIVIFLELLHLLIARNRDLLLNVIQERRKDTNSHSVAPPTQPIARAQTASQVGAPNPRSLMRHTSFDGVNVRDATRKRVSCSVIDGNMRNRNSADDYSRSHADDQSYSAASLAGGGGGNVRTDSAIAVQSELQRAFISLTKALYPGISGIMQSDSPRWLKHCCQENYFSLGTYRQTQIPISEELYFSSASENFNTVPNNEKMDPGGFSNPLNADYMGGGSDHRNGLDRATTASPSASVASSAYSRTSGSIRHTKKSEVKNEF